MARPVPGDLPSLPARKTSVCLPICFLMLDPAVKYRLKKHHFMRVILAN